MSRKIPAWITKEMNELNQEREELLSKSAAEWTAADAQRGNEVADRLKELEDLADKPYKTGELLRKAGLRDEKRVDEDGNLLDDPQLSAKGMPSPVRSAAAFGNFTRKTAQAFRNADPAVGGVTKSLVPNGAITIDYSGHIAIEPQAQMFIASAIPTVAVDVPQGAYLRQIQRENEAAPVTLGTDKPVSKYGFMAENWKVATLAHLSEPIERAWVNDFVNLIPALSSEMGYGLALALDEMIINGAKAEDGSDIPGLLTMSGVLETEAQSDALKSLRWGIGDLEEAGVAPSTIVMHPQDWRDVDLLREDGASGKYLLSEAPQGKPVRQVWGVPVVLANSIPKGEALIFDSNALAIPVREGVTLAWSEHGTYTETTGIDTVTRDLFGSNRLRFRAEGRFGLVVSQPHAICHVDLAA